ncbi:MAG: ribonuclease E/G [Geminicoccaceae bacterium]
MREVVIEPTGFGLRGAFVDGGRLIEIADVDATGDSVTDGLFLGRVDRVDRQLGAAFVDIGIGEAAFLGAKDARAAAGTTERLPIDRLVREGQRLVVQGVREPVDGKGARVTADIRLFGFALILRPRDLGVDVPARLGERQREALAQRGKALFGEAGVTLRRLAVQAGDELLTGEFASLRERWQRLQREAGERQKPGRLQADEPPLERLLRQMLEQAPERVVTADPVLGLALRTLVGERLPGWKLDLVRLPADGGAFAQTGVAAGIDEALGRDVPLPGGGRLRIEETAACVAIDVDGGARTPLDVDLSAAHEVARQVRLRNLGGTIVVDFVDLASRPERQRLEEALKKAFRDDPLPPQIYPMSPLGLVQMSRPRRGRTLANLLTRPCRSCDGTGREPSLRALAERLIGELRQRSVPPRGLSVSRELAGFLKGEAAAAWTAAATGVEPAIDPALPREGRAYEVLG